MVYSILMFVFVELAFRREWLLSVEEDFGGLGIHHGFIYVIS